MTSLLFGGSVLAAFLAGGLALLAPCCITFLLPAYFASAFRERRSLLMMTFVFASGIALVLVPIALGLAALSQVFSRFHRELSMAGGAFLMLVGILALSGKGMTPAVMRAPDLKRRDPLAVMGLGVFSGVASSCCTPVLAGVLALTALSASLVHAVTVSLAYVAGMVFPMLALAYFWDERQWADSPLLRGKRIRIRLPGGPVTVHSTNLTAGALFTIMGAVVFLFGLLGGSVYAPRWQTELGSRLGETVRDLLARLTAAEQGAAGAVFLLIVFALAVKAFRSSKAGRKVSRRLPQLDETLEHPGGQGRAGAAR
ncbi:MAG: cytochrome c biogenesis CcdA family protein [bacterium]